MHLRKDIASMNPDLDEEVVTNYCILDEELEEKNEYFG